MIWLFFVIAATASGHLVERHEYQSQVACEAARSIAAQNESLMFGNRLIVSVTSCRQAPREFIAP